MKRLVLAGLAAAMLATGAPAAQADPDRHYSGGCSFTRLPDLSTSSQWAAEVRLVAVATRASDSSPTPTEEMTGSCDLRINGTYNGTVLGPVSGTGAIAGVDAFQYLTDSDDVIELCDDITVAGEAHYVCRRTDPTPIPPDEVIEALVMILDILNELVFEPTDVLTCAVLAALAPTVNALNRPDLVHIDEDAPEDGGADLWVLGQETWLCPEYET